MTTRLVLSKMNTKDSQKRPLCLAITRAVVYLENQLEQKDAGSRLAFIEALAGAATCVLKLYEIVDCLVTNSTVLLNKLQRARENKLALWRATHPGVEQRRYPIEYLTPNSDSYTDSAPQGALIAALSTKRFQLAKQLLRGVKATTRSPTFGVPLQVAAAMGLQEFVQIVLDGLLGQGKEDVVDTPGIIESARRFVLQGAAVGGHEHLVRMILVDLKNNRESSSKRLTRSIMLAVENGHEDIASLLLQHRTPILPREPTQYARSTLESPELSFLRNLSQKAVRHGCENILRVALESAELVRGENNRPSEEGDTYLGGV